MPKVLFIHNGAPGRFGPIAGALLARGWNGALINGPAGTDTRLRRAARATVLEKFDRATICEPAWLELIGAVCGAEVEGRLLVN